MKRYIYLIFTFFLLMACKKSESNLDVSAYQNAVKHLPQNLDKFLGKKIKTHMLETSYARNPIC